MTRVTIRSLFVQETPISTSAVLPPGTILSECRVVRHHVAEGAEPYLVHFASGGRSYTCPLYAFQPRTEALDAESAESLPAPAAVAV